MEKFQESLAVSASLKDQVQTLEKENKDVKEKLKNLSSLSRQENLTSSSRDLYPARTDLGISRQDHTSINGYPERQQYDGLESQIDIVRWLSDNDRYTTRDFTSNTRHSYDSPRLVLKNTRYQSGHTSPTNPSRPQSDDDDVTSGITDHDYRHLLPRRSRSSDSLRGEFSHGTQDATSPNQKRGVGRSQEMGRRGKYPSPLHHLGNVKLALRISAESDEHDPVFL